MRKVIFIIIVGLMLSSCGSGLKPLEVNYEVTTIDEYERMRKASRVSSKFSSYQLAEIADYLNSVKPVMILDTLYLGDKTKIDINIEDLKGKYPECENIKILFSDEINLDNAFSFNWETTDEVLLESVLNYDALKNEVSGNVYPITKELKILAETAKDKSEFVNSLRDICI